MVLIVMHNEARTMEILGSRGYGVVIVARSSREQTRN